VIVLLRRTGECLLVGVLAAAIYLQMDKWQCGEANGENAAGGGAAIGMFALFWIAPRACAAFLAVLGAMGLARRSRGLSLPALTPGVELSVIAVLAGLWAIGAFFMARRFC